MTFTDLVSSVFFGTALAIFLFAWIWTVIDLVSGKWGLFTLFKLGLVIFVPFIGIVFHILTRKRKEKVKLSANGIL